MNVWKKYITTANRHFSEEKMDSAKQLYKLACEEAYTQYLISTDYEDSTSALVISYLNLACLVLKEGDDKGAGDLIKQIHRQILQDLMRTPVSDPRSIALRLGADITYEALIDHTSASFFSA